jgi:hypothetical protein
MEKSMELLGSIRCANGGREESSGLFSSEEIGELWSIFVGLNRWRRRESRCGGLKAQV